MCGHAKILASDLSLVMDSLICALKIGENGGIVE